MTVTLEIPTEVEAWLKAEAQACGVPLSEFVRDFLIDQYQEEADLLVAETRLEGPQPPISQTQLLKNLGLDS